MITKNYKQLAETKISNTRSIVVSEFVGGGYTLAQQAEVKEGDNVTSIFLKGAFHVDNVQGLKSIVSAIQEAITKIESKQEKINNNVQWDEDAIPFN